MKHSRFIIVFLSAAFIAGILVFTALQWARKSVASEGYDTEEAGWNYILRSGEIRFRLQAGSEIWFLSSGNEAGIVASPTEAYVKLSYGKFISSLGYRDRGGQAKKLKFHTAKFNDWNRMLYREDEDGNFSRYDNGVIQECVVLIENG